MSIIVRTTSTWSASELPTIRTTKLLLRLTSLKLSSVRADKTAGVISFWLMVAIGRRVLALIVAAATAGLSERRK